MMCMHCNKITKQQTNTSIDKRTTHKYINQYITQISISTQTANSQEANHKTNAENTAHEHAHLCVACRGRSMKLRCTAAMGKRASFLKPAKMFGWLTLKESEPFPKQVGKGSNPLGNWGNDAQHQHVRPKRSSACLHLPRKLGMEELPAWPFEGFESKQSPLTI